MDALAPIIGWIAERLGAEIEQGPVTKLLGPTAHVGTSRALASSAIELSTTVGATRHSVWIAAPELSGVPESGLAPVFLHADRRMVMPTVRLFVGDADSAPPEFLTLQCWLDDALRRWRFQRTPEGGVATIEEQFANLSPSAALDLMAIASRYALFGSSRTVRRHGLVFPPAPMWVRPVGDTAFAAQAARSLIVTARIDLSDPTQPAIPSGGMRAEKYRIRPAHSRDRGIDPFHTPEGTEIRLTGRLGIGVAITPDRRLAPPPGLALGPSTSRLPFAGFNDPRRLLMAANMQTQAVDVEGAEKPLATVDGLGDAQLSSRSSESCGPLSCRALDPPGVNLRVAYLAWQGWNHEDGWVISESAARRLAAVETTQLTLERKSLELDEPALMKVGQAIHRGELLIRRRFAPALLTDDLEVLASLQDFDETISATPEVGDYAPHDGEVVSLESFDLLDESGLPEGMIAAAGLAARVRRVFRVAIRRKLPLSVGDKLANRHGHKGVIGLILPDEQMPRWQGKPIDALIDPISVLNRSNWGQLREAHSWADPSRDAQGRSIIEPPTIGDWLTGPVRAIAGQQFVMRMPQHAADKLAAKPSRTSALRGRAQRFGEMDHWALWAHGPLARAGVNLSASAARLSRLLGGAGFRMHLVDQRIDIDRWPLDADPPQEFERLSVESFRRLSDAYDQIDADSDRPQAMTFDPPIEATRWLPLIPASDRPPRRQADGSEEPHDLTRDLRRLIRALRKKDESSARYALRRLMHDAYSEAVGQAATGHGGSKAAWLRRGVLGQRVAPSGRAVISPAGQAPCSTVAFSLESGGAVQQERVSGGLSLDEIGIPPAIALSLYGIDQPAEVDGRNLWLKRDPVLHRWGLLAMRVRVLPGTTVRMPPSLLGPLGADFDGDTVAFFTDLPDSPIVETCHPSAIAWDGDATSGRAVFVPGKQYIYGLHLLRQSPERLAQLQTDLQEAGAPQLGESKSVKADFEQWVRDAASGHNGQWWAIIERHAMAALAEDPGMGLGLMTFDQLKALPVVQCGAAKDTYSLGRNAERMKELINGRGLEVYSMADELDDFADPIAGVMVASKSAVGRFGGALRRLLYSLPQITPELIGAAQTLTEQITQRSLSVKAGEPPVSVSEFEAEMRRLLNGEDPPPETGSSLRIILADPRMRRVWTTLQAAFRTDSPNWLAWLRSPHELSSQLAQGVISIPITDLRARPFLDSEIPHFLQSASK